MHSLGPDLVGLGQYPEIWKSFQKILGSQVGELVLKLCEDWGLPVRMAA